MYLSREFWRKLGLGASVFAALWGVFVWLRPVPFTSSPNVRPVYLFYADGQPAIDLVVLSAEGETFYPDRRGVVLIPHRLFGTTVCVHRQETWEQRLVVKLEEQAGFPTRIVAAK
jgi:hypothetical protein